VAGARHIEELSVKELAEVERVEAELDTFIEKRAREAKDANRTAELWLKSEREHCEKRRQANGWGWIRHHEGLAHTLRGLAQEHEDKANHVRGLLGLKVLPEPSKNGHHGLGEKAT
jgi:hypothetical protein